MEIDMTSDNKDAQSVETSDKTPLENFKLSRKNFLLNYKLHCALRSVVIYPFEPETFGCSDFLKWIAKAQEYFVKKSWKSNRPTMASACVMTFATYADADNAICDLRLALGNGIVVRHTKDNIVNPEVEVDNIVEHHSKDSLALRFLVLEGVPSSTTQEQLSEFFPDAKTILFVSHDPQHVTGMVLVEYSTAEKAREVLEEHYFAEEDRSYIVVEGWQVFMFKYKSRQNQFDRANRKHQTPDRRKSFERSELSDDERMAKCDTLRQLTETREACLDDLSTTPEQRILTFVSLSEEMTLLAATLNWDAGRREREHLSLPEPQELKTWKQLYKDDQTHGNDAIVKPHAFNSEKSVPSLLDMNPFEVVGMKRHQNPPQDLIPAKMMIESSQPSDLNGQSQNSLSGCMENIKSLSSNLASQVRTMEDLLQKQQQSQNKLSGGDPMAVRPIAQSPLITNIPSLTRH